MKNRKGQVATEFLMTYGWAILIVALATVMAWQWGLFNPGGAVKPGSAGFWGIRPTDFRYVSSGELHLSLINDVGGTVNITSVTAKLADNTYTNTSIKTIRAGETGSYTITGMTPLSAGSNYQIPVIITYNDTRVRSEILMSSGRIWGSAEE